MPTIPVQYFVYAANGSGLLPGALADQAFEYFRRRNADNTVTNLIGDAPDFVDNGGGSYGFNVDQGLLTPGSTIDYVVNTGPASAGSKRIDGSLGAAAAGTDEDDSVTVVDENGEVLLSQGDLAPPFEYVLRDQEGNPVDLTTGAPTVVFNMLPAAGGTPVEDGAAVVIVDAAAGKVRYTWVLADSEDAGQFLAQFVLTQNGRESTYPVQSSIIVRVAPRLV